MHDEPSATTTTSRDLALDSLPTPFPRPFDSNLGNNFTTATCPRFFDRFLTNPTLIDCLPLSLLLQTSNAFFSASRSRVQLAAILDASCHVDFPRCSALMAGLAQELREPSNCAADFALSNPTVAQAHRGLLAYDTLFHAGCRTDDSDGPGAAHRTGADARRAGAGAAAGRTGGGGAAGYCFANAVTNASAPTSSYIYYLPLGVRLPGGSRPACTSCLQSTMAIYASAAGDDVRLPIRPRDYAAATEQVRMSCGPDFLRASAVLATSSAPRKRGGWDSMVVAVVLLLLWLVHDC